MCSADLKEIFENLGAFGVTSSLFNPLIVNLTAFADELFECVWPICGVGA